MWHYQATPNGKLTTSPEEFRMRMLLSNEGEMDAGHQKKQMPIINLKRNSNQEARTRLSILQFISVAQSCPTLCDPMNRSTPGLPVHHQLLEFTQTHVHRVSDAIRPSHPLSSPSPLAPNPSQHQSFSNESTLCMKWRK